MDIYDQILHANKPYFIAEAADAHYGSVDRAIAMVDAALNSGADAIKFQHHIPDEEMLKEIPLSKNMAEPLYDFLAKNALNIDEHQEIFNYCKIKKIEYLCTPFSLKAAQELEEKLSLPLYKIGSGELTDLPTLNEIAKFRKPMIVSTGMSTPSEIKRTYDFLVDRNVKLILMNCTSAYPPNYSDLNLGYINIMKHDFPKAIIGHSDHTNEIYSSLIAIAFGAKIIEKHVTIDNNLSGPDANVSLTFSQLKELIVIANKISTSMSDKKIINNSEEEIIQWARRSLVYLKSFKKGHIITPEDIWGKRPGTGVPSANYWEIIGKTLAQDVSANTLLSMEDF